MTLRESAAWWAELGGLTFPLTRKKPTRPKDDGGQGFKDANLSAEGFTAAEWSRSDGLGLRTGSPSGLTVLDVDSDEGRIWLAGICAVNGYDLEAVPTVLSAKGPHYYFRPPQGVEIPRKIRLLPGIDILGDGGYVVAPGSLHPGDPELGIAPGHLYVWAGDPPESLEDIPELPKFLLDAILEALSKPKPRQAHDDRPERTAEPLGASEGRNSYLASVAGKLAAQGLEAWIIEAAVLALNDDPEVISVPLPESEIRGTIFKSIPGWIEEAAVDTELGTEWGEPEGEETPSRFLTVEQIEAREAPPMLVDGMLVSESVAVVYGKPGSKKTFLCLDLALSVASGSKFCGYDVKQGPVIYALAEGFGMVKDRVRAWRDQHPGADLSRFRIVDAAPRLMEPKNVKAFCDDVARELGETPVLVVLDTLAVAMLGAEENSAKDMGQAMSSLRLIQRLLSCCVIPVHHSNAAETRERGSVALRGNVDTMLKVVASGSLVEVTSEKSRDLAPFRSLSLNAVSSGKSLYLSVDSGLESTSPSRLRILRVVDAGDGVGSVTATMVAQETGLHRSGVYKGLKALAAQGLIVIVDKGRYNVFEMRPAGRELLDSVGDGVESSPI